MQRVASRRIANALNSLRGASLLRTHVACTPCETHRISKHADASCANPLLFEETDGGNCCSAILNETAALPWGLQIGSHSIGLILSESRAVALEIADARSARG